jgi:recombination associated protein RdgC
MVYRSGELKWQFTVKGESLNISSLITPKTDLPDSNEDIEGAVLEKIFLYERVVALLDYLFKHFSKLRVSSSWQSKAVSKMIDWVQS